MSDLEHFLARWSRRKRAASDERALPSTPRPAGEDEPAEATPPRPAPEAAAASAPAAESERKDADAAGGASPSPQPPFDVGRLPPIESITAATDIRPFLAPGVPPDLARAALRRAWTADPKIRDFVGLADYDWDFNAANAVAGFGTLEMTDELRREVARIVGLGAGGEERPPPALPPEPAAIGATKDDGSAAASGGAADATLRVPVRPLPAELAAKESAAGRSAAILQCDEAPAAAPSHPETSHPAKAEIVQSAARRSHGRALPK